MRSTRLIVAAAVASVMTVTLVGQSQTPRTAAAARPAAAAKPPLNPRTADGHPDLQGFYDLATLTPLERPAMFGNNLTLTQAAGQSARKAGGRSQGRCGAAERRQSCRATDWRRRIDRRRGQRGRL